MSITKRLRYEVLRRCDFACFYCGGKAPRVELQVDHVVPRSRGGRDEFFNLTAACADCNAGKSDGFPLEETVQRVIQDCQFYILSHSKGTCFCVVCGVLVGPEPEVPEWDEIAQCSRCNEVVSDAYEAGLRAGMRHRG